MKWGGKKKENPKEEEKTNHLGKPSLTLMGKLCRRTAAMEKRRFKLIHKRGKENGGEGKWGGGCWEEERMGGEKGTRVISNFNKQRATCKDTTDTRRPFGENELLISLKKPPQQSPLNFFPFFFLPSISFSFLLLFQ